MSTVVTNVRKNRGSFWAVVIAGGAIATLAGLATVESVLFTTIRADARVAATQNSPVGDLRRRCRTRHIGDCALSGHRSQSRLLFWRWRRERRLLRRTAY